MRRVASWRNLDLVVLLLVAVLLGCGVLFAWSATRGEEGGLYGHLLRVGISLPFLVFPMLWRPRDLRRNALGIYLAALALLLAVKIFGTSINGAKRWIDVGVLHIQPSEFMKVALILALAKLLRNRRRAQSLDGIALALVLSALPALAILTQPDLGTAMVLAPVVLGMMIASGAHRRHVALLVVAGLASLPLGFLALRPYQRARILSWWNQNNLDQSQRLNEGYHLHNSKIAIGSGGITGLGLGEGPHNQLHYLPFRESDFIFPVIAEELGFLGAALVILIYSALGWRLFDLALRVREPFARLVTVGVACLFSTHLFINVGVTMGLVPTTGLTLPLISHGGSSLMASFLALGLALSMALHHEPVYTTEARLEAHSRLRDALPGARRSTL